LFLVVIKLQAMDEQRTTPADVSMPGTSIAERPANQHMARFSDPLLMRKSDGAYVWSHTHGLVHSGMEHLYRTTSDEALADYIQVYADHFIDAEGNIESFEVTDYNIDSINAGKILFFLYERTGDERYRIAMGKLREQLEWHPRAHSGGFWHKRKYPWQIWLDGLSKDKQCRYRPAVPRLG
jgi:unsaturated rhamnogalacturonyl hydrolase